MTTTPVKPRSLHVLASPARFAAFARIATPLTGVIALLLTVAGLYFALFHSPPDYQQGMTVRIMYVHVPAAWMALCIYTFMAASSASFLIWKHPLAALAAREMAPIGATFTAICLITGMFWGKPMWGAYWVWDARLTSMLILFFMYLGFIALCQAGSEDEKLSHASSWLTIVGIINLPIIKFSVEWWNTLHQPASVLRMGGPTIDGTMLTPLLVMAAAALLLSLCLTFWRMNIALTEQKLKRLHARAFALHTRQTQPLNVVQE